MGRAEEQISIFTCDRCNHQVSEKDFGDDVPKGWANPDGLCIVTDRGRFDHSDEIWCEGCTKSFQEWFETPTRPQIKDTVKELHS